MKRKRSGSDLDRRTRRFKENRLYGFEIPCGTGKKPNGGYTVIFLQSKSYESCSPLNTRNTPTLTKNEAKLTIRNTIIGKLIHKMSSGELKVKSVPRADSPETSAHNHKHRILAMFETCANRRKGISNIFSITEQSLKEESHFSYQAIVNTGTL